MLQNVNVINIDEELCTGCRQCAEVCSVNAIEGEFGNPQRINNDICVMCGQCVQACSSYEQIFNVNDIKVQEKLKKRGMLEQTTEPLFAAYNMGQVRKVKEILNDSSIHKIVQCAPAVRVALAEEFGLPFGTLTPGKMASALRGLKFDKIYDTNFAADLTIIEEGNELIKRILKKEKLPMFTSCCPAWVKFAEQEYPELLSHLSTCKSPQQMAGAIFKTYGAKIEDIDPAKIFTVAIMPCTCKGYESDRKYMDSSRFKDVDLVITTRELAYLIKDKGIDFRNLPEEDFDKPLGNYSGAGTIFGVTGGVMEAAIRTGYELITKEEIQKIDLEFIRGEEGIRDAVVNVGELQLKIAVVSGLKNVIPILEKVKQGKCEYDFIEVMTCPQGCISGGGQPKILLKENTQLAYKSRREAIYKHDCDIEIRKSHKNPDIKKLYDDFLNEPLGHISHELLHTKYTVRKK